MGWWDDYLAELIKNTNTNLSTFDDSLAAIDADLMAQRGVGPAILRGIFKAFHLFWRAIFFVGNKVFPGPIADPKVLFAASAVNVPKESWDATINRLATMFDLDSGAVKTLKSFGQALEGTSPIVQGASLILTYVAILQFLMGPAVGKINQSLLTRYRPVAANPGSILGARALDPSIDERIWKAMARNGIDEDDIELLFLSTYMRLPLEIIRDVYYREGKPVEWVDHRLEELGLTPERREEVKKTFPIIPGIQDLIMMQAKEAFELDQIAKFGLGAEAPTDIYEHTRKQGLSDDWTNKYWISHWEHASYGQVMEMLHRGYISLDDVYEWYRLVEIPPYWRDLLTKIAYSPYTRVDVRRMHAAGVIGDDELIQAMKDIGYDQEHAEKMAEFYKRYNAGTEKELSKADIEKAYEDRDLSYSTAINLLTMIGYNSEIANFYLSRIDLEMERATRLERIELVKEKMLANLYSADQARNALIGYGVTLERIAELLDRWNVQVVKNTKLPSKTDLDKFVRARVLDESGYRTEMNKLGYDKRYTDLYWQYLETGGA